MGGLSLIELLNEGAPYWSNGSIVLYLNVHFNNNIGIDFNILLYYLLFPNFFQRAFKIFWKRGLECRFFRVLINKNNFHTIISDSIKSKNQAVKEEINEIQIGVKSLVHHLKSHSKFKRII